MTTLNSDGPGRKPYIRPVSKTTWYLRKGRYKKYMLREVTCIIVALYSFLAIWGIGTLARGEDSWNNFLALQQSLGWTIFHAVMLIFFTIFQTFDWFKLAPKAMPLQLGEHKLGDRIIVIAHYAVWLVVSAVIFRLAGVI
jgi:fumarate reductase subunit C